MPAPPQSTTTPPPLHRLWLTVGDGLQIQRVHLYLDEWHEILTSDAPLPDLEGGGVAAALAANPVPDITSASSRIDAAGLRPFIDLAARYAFPVGPTSALGPTALAQASALTRHGVRQVVAADLTAVCSAAAWLVGFLAVIRQSGVHHVTLRTDKPPLELAVLREACGVVALGMAIRVLEEHLRADGVTDDRLRGAYCQALATSVTIERRMPELLEKLAELRLVDLVSMSVPWRGRFTKYAGGTGAGQVE